MNSPIKFSLVRRLKNKVGRGLGKVFQPKLKMSALAGDDPVQKLGDFRKKKLYGDLLD